MIWHSSETTDILNSLNVDASSGLSHGVADERIVKYGKNSTSQSEKTSLFERFLSQLKHKTVYFLIAVALISFVVELIYKQNNPFFALLIIAIVVVNAFISAYHLCKCDEALDSIRNASMPTATVIRDGVEQKINSSQLVPGDIIIVREGDYITADARLIEADGLRCNEAQFSDVLIPVEKKANVIFEDITPITQRQNMLFTGCSVVHGYGKAVVVETGFNTELGKNLAIEIQTNSENLPISEKLDSTGKIVNLVILVLCAIAFIIGMLQNFSSEAPFASTTMHTLMSVVALGISAMPESLPAISTIVVALGIQRIISDNIVIKKTKAIELIGKTSVICADKTGILTKNNMVLSAIYDGEHEIDLENDTLPEKSAMVLRLAAACSTLDNDSTERAIEEACIKYNAMSKADVENLFPRLAVIPFDSQRKTMTSINMINGHPVAIVKGAPEILLEKCNNANREEMLKLNDELASKAYRVICIAIKGLPDFSANPNPDEIESDLTFIGLLGISDPPQSDTVEAIKACDIAGIRTIMITGDNLITAKAIARRIGILKDGTEAISGAQLSEMSDEELIENIEKYSVFARVSPEDKLRIISAWQKNGQTVTITGNGIEDADALSCADVGCAIGNNGTDVAKGNADVIISKNKFMEIVNAIKESRGLFENIKKSVSYLLSCNFAEIVAYIFGMIIFGMPPLLAVQLLWINLLTDSTCVISLTVEKAEFDVMRKKPLALTGHLFSINTVINIVCEIIFMATVTLIAFAIGNKTGLEFGYTMAFATLSIIQIFHAFNLKSRHSLFKTNFKSNKFMNCSTVLILFIILFLSLTPAGILFGLAQLNIKQIGLCLLLAATIFVYGEVGKFADQCFRKKNNV